MSDPTDDAIDQALAEGFARLEPSEDRMSALIAATQAHDAIHPPSSTSGRLLPSLFIAFAIAAVALLVLRGTEPPPSVEEPQVQPATIPAGKRAVTLAVPTEFVSLEDIEQGALVDIVSMQRNKTVTLLSSVLLLASGPDTITVTCSPAEAEQLVLAQELGPIVPMVADGDRRLVTVPVNGAPLDPSLVQPGMHTDVLVTMQQDGDLETLTLLVDVVVHRVHPDGRATLALTAAQGERLLHAVDRGPLSLSLRAD